MAEFTIPSPRQVKAIRAWFGMSQSEFAQGAGLSITTMVEFEKAKRALARDSLEQIARYASRLDVVFRRDGALVLPE